MKLPLLKSFGTIENAMRTFFTSDTHFFHKNIIKYCKRPWYTSLDSSSGVPIVSDDDVVRMNASLVQLWNSVVEPDDEVWHLGDFAFGIEDVDGKIPDIVSKLNGKINLVLGNHDSKDDNVFLKAGIRKVYDRPVLFENWFLLSHEPLEFINSSCPFVNVFGHVHDNANYKTLSECGYCVCVERHDYKPVDFEEMKKRLAQIRS